MNNGFKSTEIGLIPKSWEIKKIGNLIEEKGISVGVMYPGKHTPGGIPLIKAGDVSNGKIRGISFLISKEVNQTYRRTILQGGELLVVLVGEPGLSVVVPDHCKGWNAARALAVLKLLNSDNGLFISYALQSREVKHILYSYCNTTVQATLNLKELKQVPIPWPSKIERNNIVYFLSSLDKKVELYRQMNQTLEAMAQALFKSWFVDFDPVMDNALAQGHYIPDELQAMVEKRQLVPDSKKLISTNPELASKFPSAFEYNETLGKWIPEGWEVKTIDDAATIVGGGTPSTKEESYYTDNGIPWLSPKDLSGYNWKFISKGASDITELGLQKSSAKLMPKGTVLFSSRAPIGYIAIAENEVCTNQGFKSLIPNKGVPTEYLFQFLKSNADKIDSVASGSTFKEVSGSALKGIEILIADKKILNYYSEKLEPINSRAIQIQKETETLTNLRDRILPELISGRVRVMEGMIEQH